MKELIQKLLEKCWSYTPQFYDIDMTLDDLVRHVDILYNSKPKHFHLSAKIQSKQSLIMLWLQARKYMPSPYCCKYILIPYKK